MFNSEDISNLAPRREPYWEKVRKGLYVGVRRIPEGATWIGRVRDDEGKHKYKSFGDITPEFGWERAVQEAVAFGNEIAPNRAYTVSLGAGDFKAAGGTPPWLSEVRKDLEGSSAMFATEFANALYPKLIHCFSIEDQIAAFRQAFIEVVEAKNEA